MGIPQQRKNLTLVSQDFTVHQERSLLIKLCEAPQIDSFYRDVVELASCSFSNMWLGMTGGGVLSIYLEDTQLRNYNTKRNRKREIDCIADAELWIVTLNENHTMRTEPTFSIWDRLMFLRFPLFQNIQVTLDQWKWTVMFGLLYLKSQGVRWVIG